MFCVTVKKLLSYITWYKNRILIKLDLCGLQFFHSPSLLCSALTFISENINSYNINLTLSSTTSNHISEQTRKIFNICKNKTVRLIISLLYQQWHKQERLHSSTNLATLNNLCYSLLPQLKAPAGAFQRKLSLHKDHNILGFDDDEKKFM